MRALHRALYATLAVAFLVGCNAYQPQPADQQQPVERRRPIEETLQAWRGVSADFAIHQLGAPQRHIRLNDGREAMVFDVPGDVGDVLPAPTDPPISMQGGSWCQIGLMLAMGADDRVNEARIDYRRCV
jgi:hypothetical protein